MNKRLMGAVFAVLLAASAGPVFALGVEVDGRGEVDIKERNSSLKASMDADVEDEDLAEDEDSDSRFGVADEVLEAALDKSVEAGAVSAAAKAAILEMRADRDDVKTEADLEAYSRKIAEKRPAVREIKVEGNGVVAVNYIQKARLFGIFPSSVKGTVRTDADGNVEVKLPWWSVFFRKNSDKVKSAVAAAVQASKDDRNVEASAEARAQANADLINAVTAAVDAEASAEAD